MSRKPLVRVKKQNSIEDVARVAGVSIATVSRVLNKSGTVREKNRAKVLAVVKEMKFQPSATAQRLASGKSNVVALVIPRYEGMFYSFYLLELIRGIGTLCEALKLDLLLQLTDSTSLINTRSAGGIIFADVIGNRPQIEDAFGTGVPCVVINNFIEDLPINCIAVDNMGGAQQAVNYLVSLGHRKIAHISGDLITQAAALRLQGYKLALRQHNIALREEYIFETDYSRGQARQAAEKMFTMANAPTAVFVSSDSMAMEVMEVATERGKLVPKDISVVGFDDNPSGLYGHVSLTTVRQPLVRMAQESVKRLHTIMRQDKASRVEKTLLPAELVIRESCLPYRS